MPYTGLSFAVLDIAYKKLIDGYQITVTTDVPSHLWLRWTNHEPQIHDKPVLKRGILLNVDRRFCFVVYEDNEQIEPGDTTTHTFLKHNWPSCETRYFYFLGTIAGNPSPSTTAIFNKHFHILKATFLGTLSNRTIDATSVNWDTAHDTASGNILTNYDTPWYNLTAGTELTASFFIYRTMLFFDTSQIPVGSTIVAATLELWIKVKYANYLPYTYLQITEGVQHNPVIPTDYGDQLPYTTILGQANIQTMTINQYNSIPFNDAGLPIITPGGITQLCLRGQMDVLDIPSIVVYANYIQFNSAQKGSGYEPKLSVWYQ